MTKQESLIEIKSLYKRYRNKNDSKKSNSLTALNNVSLNIFDNEILGLIGESGSGKTTLAKSLVNLIKPDSGNIYYNDADLVKLSSSEFRPYTHKLQMVFQNPVLALNPSHTIGFTLAEPLKVILKISKTKIQEKVYELLSSVGLDPEIITRFPHQLSGGQKQRVAFARAISINPSILIADEPTSSLDTDLKNQVLQLIVNIKKELGLTVLLISHDIASVESIADRIAVMYKGSLVETGPVNDVINTSLHPYTKELIAASYLKYNEMSNINTIKKENEYFAGCPYYQRCPIKQSHCKDKIPVLKLFSNNHSVACHLATNDQIDSQASEKTISDKFKKDATQ